MSNFKLCCLIYGEDPKNDLTRSAAYPQQNDSAMSLAINTEANYEYETFVLGPGAANTPNIYNFISVGRKTINYAAVERFLITGLGFQGTTITVQFQDFLSTNELNVYLPSAANAPNQLVFKAFEITAFNIPVTYHEYRNPWCLWEGAPQGTGERGFSIVVNSIQPYDSIRLGIKFRVVRDHSFGHANDYVDTLNQWSKFKG